MRRVQPIEDPYEPLVDARLRDARGEDDRPKTTNILVSYEAPPNTTLDCDPVLHIGCLAVITVTYSFTLSTPFVSSLIGPFTMSQTSRCRSSGCSHDGPPTPRRVGPGHRGDDRRHPAEVALVATIVDEGNVFAQQRVTQNGVDAAAEAGAGPARRASGGRGRTLVGWDVNIGGRIQQVAEANNITVHAAYYTDICGIPLRSDGTGAIDEDTRIEDLATALQVGNGSHICPVPPAPDCPNGWSVRSPG